MDVISYQKAKQAMFAAQSAPGGSSAVSFISDVKTPILPGYNNEQFSTSNTVNPILRSNMTMVYTNGVIYTFGGTNSKEAWSYTISTDTWTRLTDAPTIRQHARAIVYNGKIYIVGGYNGSAAVNTLEVYDIVTNTYITKTPMPTARYRVGVCVANNKLYVIGGYIAGPTTVHEIFDLIAETWSTSTVMNVARDSATAICPSVTPTKIFVFGNDLTSVSVFDTVALTWTAGTTLPSSRNNCGAVEYGGKIYLTGNSSGQIDTYNPSNATVAAVVTNTHSQFPIFYSSFIEIAFINQSGKISIFSALANTDKVYALQNFEPDTVTTSLVVAPRTWTRNGVAVAYANGNIYMIGGNGGHYPTTTSIDISTGIQLALQRIPTPRNNASAVYYDGKIYVLGGQSVSSTYLTSMEVYDIASNTWSSKGTIPGAAGAFVGSAAFDGKIYSFGGSNGTSSSVIGIYDIATNTWKTSSASLPNASSGYSAIEHGGMIYIFGSSTTNNTISLYNPSNDSIIPSYNTLSTGRGFISSLKINGLIYLYGGYGSASYPKIDIYNPSTNTLIAGKFNLQWNTMTGNWAGAVVGPDGLTIHIIDASNWNKQYKIYPAQQLIHTSTSDKLISLVSGEIVVVDEIGDFVNMYSASGTTAITKFPVRNGFKVYSFAGNRVILANT